MLSVADEKNEDKQVGQANKNAWPGWNELWTELQGDTNNQGPYKIELWETTNLASSD